MSESSEASPSRGTTSDREPSRDETKGVEERLARGPLLEIPPVGGSTFLTGLLAVWGVDLVLSLLVFIIIAARSGDRPLEEALVTPFGVGLLAASFALSTAVTVAATWAVLCRSRRLGLVAGLSLHAVRTRSLMLGGALGLALAAGNTLLVTQWSTGGSLIADLVATPEGLLFVSLSALVAPFSEELYYRGMVFSFLRERSSPLNAFSATALWFTVAHAPQLLGDPIKLLGILIAAVAFTGLRLGTGALLPAIVCHLTYNASLVGLHLSSLGGEG